MNTSKIKSRQSSSKVLLKPASKKSLARKQSYIAKSNGSRNLAEQKEIRTEAALLQSPTSDLVIIETSDGIPAASLELNRHVLQENDFVNLSSHELAVVE